MISSRFSIIALTVVGVAIAALSYFFIQGSGFLERVDLGILENLFSGRRVVAPPPLRIPGQSSGVLTREGTIHETNIRREQNGLGVLRETSSLNDAAERKVRDMFANQYFEHISPQGIAPEDLMGEVKYEYIVIGENLAMGNIVNDQALVDAWMASPDHRENILNSHFTEMGAATGYGVFGGENVWIAVQEFGKPLSECVQPDLELYRQIEENYAELDRREQELNMRKEELDENDPSYNQKIEEYNTLVAEYNALLTKTKEMISIYNAQVAAFNDCIEK